ncbi:RagB/SusD family nutrient uptake outer membrane protein [Mucilaginibacter sabulilitoris]|uniref:RagB/SusD family nutrient uptake outer membrane protein n=1 Tax=Mucilaginibacter sabulilitoris TaxID=1173583 RepID=A0ABZ0TGA1_9SPHI|nr:RagB/SusD family nutrient uptake outer membrane protein [Mucilaginibacter sabulilitoris]WPU92220.1 RagB/SusD family nutrient uptake outer membrane protein [Mucilaginibacter sabulilitoris]
MKIEMKKICFIISGIIFLFGSFSCTKLATKNYSQIVSSEFTPGSADVAALVGAPYTSWRTLELGRSSNAIWRTNEISADEEVIPQRPNGWVDGGIYRRMHTHKWTADEDNSYQIWTNAYAGITGCNRVLYQIDAGLIPIPTSGKAQITAELKVLRASFYYALIDFFGNVPIVTKFDLPAGFVPTQSTRKEVYDFIISELTSNVPLLSTLNDATTYGRFNKWAGEALLAKMYLNAGVYTGTPDYANCITACNTIIASGLYSLESNQANVFLQQNQNSKEILFAIPFDQVFTADGNTAWTLHMETLQPENQATYNFQNSPWGGICAIPQFINTFDPQDSRLTSNWVQGQQYTAAGAPLNGTIGAFKNKPLAYINSLPGVDSSEEVHGFRLGKYQIVAGELVGMSNDFPLLRYADVLMMKAEALLRSGDAATAATLVTQVRQRAFTSNPAKAVVTAAQLSSGSTVYDYGLNNHLTTTHETVSDIQYGRFLDELGWEFAQEGRRRQDLIRFGVFTTKSWLSHSPNGAYRTLLPIPTSALHTNGNLKQNPGY